MVASGSNYDPSGLRPDTSENQKVHAIVGELFADYQTLSPNPDNWDALFGNLSQMWDSEPDFTAEALGSIALPVLLLDGDSDELICTEHTMEMASLIPNAKLIFVPGTGHFVMVEKPAEYNAAILDFLEP